MTLAVLSEPAVQGSRELLNGMRVVVELWFCPQMPGTTYFLELPNKGENMILTMLLFP